MHLHAFSNSSGFCRHLDRVFNGRITFSTKLNPPTVQTDQIYLLHISTLDLDCIEWMRKFANKDDLIVGICSDQPDIEEMLEYVDLGARAYCNSYMQQPLYEQLARLLDNGQSWFPPQMLEQTFKLAKTAVRGKDIDALLQILTPREKEIALLVLEGLSNRHIADRGDISEPTVKTHLTNIFNKLQLKDRVALILCLK
jgi:two-component system nitrate/nitrite response regulator NarL